MPEPISNEIRPQINAFDVGMIVISLVIGVGIFRTPVIVARQAGSPEIFFSAWVVGGIVSMIGALVFAEIGSRHHFPGGFYKLISTAFHPLYAFMINWVLVLTYGRAWPAWRCWDRSTSIHCCRRYCTAAGAYRGPPSSRCCFFMSSICWASGPARAPKTY
ncbi:amino acid permease [Salmonirosea aquatica]|uniref:Amino acid permease n=1 Tax=Salmonirosea aquatica TaxID=2654236 RepID=A0A7C9BHB0_9BACT|nr:amino acid permease [Cytophagaceae bacterium SJW1-29]